jgi:hypothetical protein
MVSFLRGGGERGESAPETLPVARFPRDFVCVCMAFFPGGIATLRPWYDPQTIYDPERHTRLVVETIKRPERSNPPRYTPNSEGIIPKDRRVIDPRF